MIADLGRFLLGVAFALFGLIELTFPVHGRTVVGWLLIAVSFVASFVTLFHTVFVRLPGWPAALAALFVLLVSLQTFRHVLLHRRCEDD